MQNKISSLEIKNKFLKYFEQNDHMQISDSSIVPKNDPTLLFINSGMAPLKNYFTGEDTPPCKRLCNVQPCIRTIDIDSIGDKHHLTSFQMLGSWSIGDYFKTKAIQLAYVFLTQNLEIPKEKLYVTVFSGDENLNIPFDQEAYDSWKSIGVPEEKIVKCGSEDNFWGPTAETGPCGPCTEIFYDTGEGEKYVPGGHFDTQNRYIEIWNAGVFMQFNKNSDGTYSKLSFNSVDTGAGLERLSMALNNHKSVYETDLLCPIKEKILEEFNSKLNDNQIPEKDILILTDHLRTATLILSEKISPSNEGRGYIPRKLIRRCMMIASKNGVNDFNFLKIIEFITEKYSEIYSKFSTNKEFILQEFNTEHERFNKILISGLERLKNICKKSNIISGEDAFDLVTTYGLPFDIIKQFSEENNITVNESEYITNIKEHKEKSKNLSKNNNNLTNLKKCEKILTQFQQTEFCGYEMLRTSSKILGIIKDDVLVDKAGVGDKVGIILEKTCMYAESGGQCADTGVISNQKSIVNIHNVQKSEPGVFVHFGEILGYEIKVGDIAEITIDEPKRRAISANHTAVHLLHSVLRECYGKELHQSGSKVEDSKLRFDFNYDKNLLENDLEMIEKKVNEHIMQNFDRVVKEKTLDEAIKDGAMALFESKYGDKVRVVKYGNVSMELCGGTHVKNTGTIGLFKIISSEGIGKGLRRITAVTGQTAVEFIQNQSRLIGEICRIFKSKPENLVEKLQNISKTCASKTDDKIQVDEHSIMYGESNAGIKFGYMVFDEINKKIGSEIVKIAEKINKITVFIAGQGQKMINIAVPDSLSNNHKANEIMAELMKICGGKGGGNKKISSGGVSMPANQIIENLIKTL